MFSWLTNAWRVPELRKRVLFTAVILAFYRLGSWIPAPGVNADAIENYFNASGGGTVLALLNLFSGGALSQFAIFALGIMPYVTASIILQLMTVVIPRLEQLQKEGEAGYAKINQYTRYLTVILAAAQAAGFAFLFQRQGALDANFGRGALIVLTLTAGCALLMWMGELITKRGIGNGISLLIFASILTGLPLGINAWVEGGIFERLFFPIMAVGIVVAVVFIQEGQRRIPIQYAKRMVGRRMTTGGSTYMPLRVNMAGVIPVIFAAAVMAFPPTVAQYFPQTQTFINKYFSYTDWPYLLLQGAMIVIFTFFYTAVQFNPVDQADNLRKHGGYIPGIRPGPPTAQYLDRVLTRLTLPGAIYLAIVATLPSLFIAYADVSQALAGALGGTSVLIAVGVALDTMRQMESQMMMRSYEGFLKVNVLAPRSPGVGEGNPGEADPGRVRDPAHRDRGDPSRRDRNGVGAGPSRQADRGERQARPRRPDDRADPGAARGGRRGDTASSSTASLARCRRRKRSTGCSPTSGGSSRSSSASSSTTASASSACGAAPRSSIARTTRRRRSRSGWSCTTARRSR